MIRDAAEATRIEGTRTLDEVRTGKTTIDGVVGQLETAYKAFKEGVMADVKKLASLSSRGHRASGWCRWMQSGWYC